jgi:hypothetical protein
MGYIKDMEKIKKETKRYASAFWKGWFSVFQPLYGISLKLPDLDRGPERDVEAIASDWRQVGDDLRWAMGQIASGR